VRGHGHIVNISSAAYVMRAEHAAYCASKAAVVAFSRCLRADLASRGVGVSVISTPIMGNGRMIGRSKEDISRVNDFFQKYGHSPELVAKTIASTITHYREQVAVGLEVKVLYR
jgi:2-hydroxycyclohexanecarboxyl-CoA dehydrogenase